MISRPACLVLGAGLGALIQPFIVLGGWLLWQLDLRRHRKESSRA